MSCATGTVAALWNDPPESPVKIPGEPLAVFAFPSGERFAAHRGNAIILRYVPTNMVKKPMAKAKGFVVTAAKDETIPADAKVPIGSPQKPTFLAWHPTGKLLGGQADGTILNWGATGPGAGSHSRTQGRGAGVGRVAFDVGLRNRRRQGNGWAVGEQVDDAEDLHGGECRDHTPVVQPIGFAPRDPGLNRHGLVVGSVRDALDT